jgi:hypothetical protein
MNKEKMIKEILAYEQELKYNYKENSDAFGFSDDSTQRAVTKWLVMDELLERLNIEK